MSANLRKPAPVRQFSLNSEQPLRRKILKKQFSEDVPDPKEKWIPELGFHVSLCTTTQMKTLDRPPPAKQAWIENQEMTSPNSTNSKNEEGIVAKKCKEIKRPITAKVVVKQNSLNKDSILLSHQQLAERLRQAWKDREKGKQNLNIFLAHNVKEKQQQEDDLLNEVTETEQGTSCSNNENSAFESMANKPKIICPLKPEVLGNTDTNYKHIFQKRMRRAHSIEEPIRDIVYCPTRPLDTKSRTVVVVPLTESTKIKDTPKPEIIEKKEIQTPKLQQQQSVVKEEALEKVQEQQKSSGLLEEGKPIDVIIRPMTAVSKREGFRSRNNSAFNGSQTKENQRPPLVRASSVPLKPNQPKPKFVAQKRRIKSANKRKEKTERASEGTGSGEEYDDKDEKGKKFQRCVSISGADVVTMVSLISPEESETEEQAVEAEKEKPKPKINSVVKIEDEPKVEKVEHPKNFTLRKAVKSVSFQQSSIHAVRSFSASFPARRGSVATALMLGNNSSGGLTNNSNKNNNEKRGTPQQVPGGDDEDDRDVREPKRRLVRTKSAPQSDCSFDENETSLPDTKENEENVAKKVPNKPLLERSVSVKSEPKEENETEGTSNAEPTFDTPKEKQCWDMYCKMSKKGVSISFDTILRGMLTPTEYRLRRKSVALAENLDENNTENATS